MKNTISAGVMVPLLALSLLSPLTAFAQSAAPVATPGATAAPSATSAAPLSDAKSMKIKARADQEIDRRIAALTVLSTRVQAMQKITDALKQSIATAVQNQITAFGALKSKIDADSDAATLKTDVQAITQSYRIYALVLPQGHIAAHADRVVVLATMLTTLGTKLQGRITDAQNSGSEVGALTTALAEMSTKLKDASDQAQAAMALIVTLTPDNGDKVKMKSNLAALQSARDDLKVARKDLQAARKDADTIVKGLKTLKPAASAASVPPAASASPATH